MTHLRWETEDRYYTATLTRNLFGDWEVIRAWGGKGKASGSHRIDQVADPDSGSKLLADLDRKRRLDGYRAIVRD